MVEEAEERGWRRYVRYGVYALAAIAASFYLVVEGVGYARGERTEAVRGIASFLLYCGSLVAVVAGKRKRRLPLVAGGAAGVLLALAVNPPSLFTTIFVLAVVAVVVLSGSG